MENGNVFLSEKFCEIKGETPIALIPIEPFIRSPTKTDKVGVQRKCCRLGKNTKRRFEISNPIRASNKLVLGPIFKAQLGTGPTPPPNQLTMARCDSLQLIGGRGGGRSATAAARNRTPAKDQSLKITGTGCPVPAPCRAPCRHPVPGRAPHYELEIFGPRHGPRDITIIIVHYYYYYMARPVPRIPKIASCSADQPPARGRHAVPIAYL